MHSCSICSCHRSGKQNIKIMKISVHVSSFLILCLYPLSIIQISSAIDTINTANIIRDGDKIVSSAQSFELGFFSPGNSINRYVGIWYKNITVQTIIWVANREYPLRRNSTSPGVLTVNRSGQLVIRDESINSTIWSSNTSRVARNPVAQLLDSGNLVVREANDDRPENYLWQSFDYPTDTFLPGMDFGWNHATGKENYLSSWRTNEDPTPGDFTMGFEMTGYPQLFIKRHGDMVYRLGPWNVISFSMRGDPIVKVGSFRNNNNNNSVIYYRDKATDDSVFSRFTLGPIGLGQRWTWVNQSQEWVFSVSFPVGVCDNYGSCGAHGLCNGGKIPPCVCLDRFVPQNKQGWAAYDWSGGCVRRKMLNCKDDVFLRYTGIKMPDSRVTWFNGSLSLKECETVCLRNCSCMAYTNMSGCLLWFGELVDMRVLPGAPQEIFIRLAASELDSGTMKRKILVAVLTSLAGILLIGLCVALFVLKRKIIGQKLRREGILERSNDEDLELPIYDLSIVIKATNSFSDNNRLGEGGFGSVYKGMLEDGKEIAVKRLSKTSTQGLTEFKNEVSCIAKLQHRNLVRLLGCCIQGEEKMLIYEYMPNKSLDVILFDETKSKQLDWPQRFHVIDGIARGLVYLHQDSRLRIVHRDLKASNILLDDDFNPKISDFGLARIFGGNETEVKTKRVVGTYGYMSPEYAGYGLCSFKSDVYSFGVLVLEIVRGQRSGDFHHPDHYHDLLGHAWILYKQGRPLELVDPNIINSVRLYELERSIHVALLCVQQFPEDRPTMSMVVLMLGSEGVLPEAKQPGFFTTFRKDATWPSNEYTITQLEAR